MTNKIKLLFDANVPQPIIKFFQEKNFDLIDMKKGSPKIGDNEIFKIAIKESRTIITLDKDFFHISRQKKNIKHQGILLLRIDTPIDYSKTSSLIYNFFAENRKIENILVIVENNRIKITLEGLQ